MSFEEKMIELALLDRTDLPEDAMHVARLSLLDWITCGLAGADEPLARKLRDLSAREGGTGVASVFGGGKAPARMAALVNGGTSHALDYDDTHFGHIGHLSVGIYPAALAAAEECGASADTAVSAFLVGAEAAIRVGMALGAGHYNAGFHQTATAGAFGATVAAARIHGLSGEQMRHAIGLCSTRASGLKSQFGTMGKPLNAGIAAANGVEAALLAAMDFTSAAEGVSGLQGFFETHHRDGDPDVFDTLPAPQHFLFRNNSYKLHACCHGLHAMIEALRGAATPADLALADIRAVRIETNPRWLRVCDKKSPQTGLEVKFSYAWLAGMTLRGDNTGNDRTYTDELAADPQLTEFARKVTVTGAPDLTDMQVRGDVVLADGRTVAFAHDLAAPVPAEVLAAKLRDKACAILGQQRGAAVWDRFEALPTLSAAEIGGILTA